MLPLSYRSPKTEVRQSKIHERGLFATADIAKDEIVAVKGGHIVDRKTLREKITPRLGPVEIQIDDDLFIAPVTDEERELSMLYSNHSCDANLGMRGEITFVAMRDIRAGEELTHDWAMTDDDDYSVECKCGAPNCRKIITGKDWQRPDLQKRYAGYFSAYLARKIAMRCHSERSEDLTIGVAITLRNLCDATPSERSFAPLRMTTRDTFQPILRGKSPWSISDVKLYRNLPHNVRASKAASLLPGLSFSGALDDMGSWRLEFWCSDLESVFSAIIGSRI